jgi:hypothetical protein
MTSDPAAAFFESAIGMIPRANQVTRDLVFSGGYITGATEVESTVSIVKSGDSVGLRTVMSGERVAWSLFMPAISDWLGGQPNVVDVTDRQLWATLDKNWVQITIGPQ